MNSKKYHYIKYYRDPVTKKYVRTDEKKVEFRPKKPPGVFHTIRRFEKTGEFRIPLTRKIVKFQDRPTLRKWKPKSAVGKGIKNTLGIYKFVWNKAVTTGIIGESILRATDKATSRLVYRKIRNDTRFKLQDDVAKGFISASNVALVPIVKSIKYRKTANIYSKPAKKFVKFNKVKKSDKLDYKYNRIDLKNDLTELKFNIKDNRLIAFKMGKIRRKGVISAVNLRRYKLTKADIKILRFKRKSTKKRFLHQKKLYKANKHLLSYTSLTSPKVLFSDIKDKVDVGSDKKMREIGQNNEFVQVVVHSRDMAKVLGISKTTSQKMQSAKKKVVKTEEKFQKQEGKLRKKESALKSTRENKNKVLNHRNRIRRRQKILNRCCQVKITLQTALNTMIFLWKVTVDIKNLFHLSEQHSRKNILSAKTVKVLKLGTRNRLCQLIKVLILFARRTQKFMLLQTVKFRMLKLRVLKFPCWI